MSENTLLLFFMCECVYLCVRVCMCVGAIFLGDLWSECIFGVGVVWCVGGCWGGGVAGPRNSSLKIFKDIVYNII